MPCRAPFQQAGCNERCVASHNFETFAELCRCSPAFPVLPAGCECMNSPACVSAGFSGLGAEAGWRRPASPGSLDAGKSPGKLSCGCVNCPEQQLSGATRLVGWGRCEAGPACECHRRVPSLGHGSPSSRSITAPLQPSSRWHYVAPACSCSARCLPSPWGKFGESLPGQGPPREPFGTLHRAVG